MRFIVAQNGARRGYAVADTLAKAGLLERFFTDVCGNVGLGKILSKLTWVPQFGGQLQRVSNRRPPESVRERAYTFPTRSLRWAWQGALAGRDPVTRFHLELDRATALGQAMCKTGFGTATHLFSMFVDFPPLLTAAKARGLRVVTEVYTLMSLERILAQERRSFPDWEPNRPNYEPLVRASGVLDILFGQTDQFICPSPAVGNDLSEVWGVPTQKVRIVPYGAHRSLLETSPEPVRGRVLFVGAANLNKGFHYYAMAAAKLSRHRYDFRVAGNVSSDIAARTDCRYVRFLGRVPRDRITQEFLAADVFVLPSLAEGSSEATYEAMACGLPMVVTKAAGSVARDGFEGWIVPERDPEALARAIQSIIEDRSLRRRMAVAARERAKDFTLEKYGERLVGALTSVVQGRARE